MNLGLADGRAMLNDEEVFLYKGDPGREAPKEPEFQ